MWQTAALKLVPVLLIECALSPASKLPIPYTKIGIRSSVLPGSCGVIWRCIKYRPNVTSAVIFDHDLLLHGLP